MAARCANCNSTDVAAVASTLTCYACGRQTRLSDNVTTAEPERLVGEVPAQESVRVGRHDVGSDSLAEARARAARDRAGVTDPEDEEADVPEPENPPVIEQGEDEPVIKPDENDAAYGPDRSAAKRQDPGENALEPESAVKRGDASEENPAGRVPDPEAEGVGGPEVPKVAGGPAPELRDTSPLETGEATDDDYPEDETEENVPDRKVRNFTEGGAEADAEAEARKRSRAAKKAAKTRAANQAKAPAKKASAKKK